MELQATIAHQVSFGGCLAGRVSFRQRKWTVDSSTWSDMAGFMMNSPAWQ